MVDSSQRVPKANPRMLKHDVQVQPVKKRIYCHFEYFRFCTPAGIVERQNGTLAAPRFIGLLPMPSRDCCACAKIEFEQTTVRNNKNRRKHTGRFDKIIINSNQEFFTVLDKSLEIAKKKSEKRKTCKSCSIRRRYQRYHWSRRSSTGTNVRKSCKLLAETLCEAFCAPQKELKVEKI